MTISFNDVVKLAKAKNPMPMLRTVIFDGKSALTLAHLDYVVGVPCLQTAITKPVVVPVEAIQMHLAKSRHLIVMPDHLTNGQGLITPFGDKFKDDYQLLIDMIPAPPECDSVSFDLDLFALDRVQIAAGVADIRSDERVGRGIKFLDALGVVLRGVRLRSAAEIRDADVPRLPPELHGRGARSPGERERGELPREVAREEETAKPPKSARRNGARCAGDETCVLV